MSLVISWNGLRGPPFAFSLRVSPRPSIHTIRADLSHQATLLLLWICNLRAKILIVIPVPKTHVNTYVLLHRKLQSMQAYIFLKKIKIERLCLHIQLEPTLSHTHCNRRGPYLTIGASIKPIGMQQNRNVHSCPMMLIMLGNWPWNPVCAMQCSCLGVQKPWI